MLNCLRHPPLVVLFSLLIFTSSIYASQKKKRDISDIKDDLLLKKVFANDLKTETENNKKERKDRSINLQDEQATNQKPSQQAAFYTNYYNNLYRQPEAPLPSPSPMERRAVDPAQEAMAGYVVNPYYNGQVDRRNYIPHPDQIPDPTKDMKKSSIPEAPEASSHTDSFPLHLSVNSPNSKLKGPVPHFEEYGETVESVVRAQKRFKIPKPDYSTVIVKKSDIPHPDDDDVDDVAEQPKSFRRSKVASSSSKKHKVGDRKRQFIQYPQQMQQFAVNNGYTSNFMNAGNYLSAQQAGGAYQQMQATPEAAVASHVKNLDGAITRPVVTDKACDDQYNLCSEYAKNDYCTNYPAQMKVQCRKSCGFCVSPEARATVSESKPAEDNDDASSDDGSASGNSELIRRTFIDTGNVSRRHDILQERAHIRPQPDSDLSGDGSGSGSGSGDESGSGSGANSESAYGPNKRSQPAQARVVELRRIPETRLHAEELAHHAPDVRNYPEQEFHIPTKKDESVSTTDSDSDDDSGSGSGSGDESGDSEDQAKPSASPKVVEAPKPVLKKASKITKTSKSKKHENKRGRIPKRPEQPIFYPRIDLKEIASSLAHYEEAALELAGEYPKLQESESNEYTRSFIPHPETAEDFRTNRNRQNIQIAKIITSERLQKDNVPKFLRVAGDVKKPIKAESDADSLDSVQLRFNVPGVEPTLNDYYAETGKLNPFEKKLNSKNYKKSSIENPFHFGDAYDPYEYLRNMPVGASMEPIIDPHKRSKIVSDHSFPVFLMKVSPSEEKKYIEEQAEKRGKIRHYNAEGIEIDDNKYRQMLRGGHPEMEEAIRKQTVATSDAARIQAIAKAEAIRKQAIARAATVRKQAIANAARAKAAAAARQAIHPQAQAFFDAANRMNAPAAPPMPAFNQPQPQQSFAQMQQSLEQQASLFPNQQPVGYDQQPGANALRGKMLNAFFDVRTNGAPDEGSGSGDAGPGYRRNVF